MFQRYTSKQVNKVLLIYKLFVFFRSAQGLEEDLCLEVDQIFLSKFQRKVIFELDHQSSYDVMDLLAGSHSMTIYVFVILSNYNGTVFQKLTKFY